MPSPDLAPSSAGLSGGALSGANLETGGQNSRLRVAIFALALALTLALGLEYVGAAKQWRALLFVPFFFALFGVTQGMYRTCPGLAARGVREVCGVEEPIANAVELKRTRQLARKVVIMTTVGAVAATMVFLWLP
jgi:hypothetical protein